MDSPDLTLDVADLKAADVQARANSFRKLIEGGLETDKALAMSGLLASGDS